MSDREDRHDRQGDGARRTKYTKPVSIKKRNPWESDDEEEDCKPKIPQLHLIETPDRGYFHPHSSFYENSGRSEEADDEEKGEKLVVLHYPEDDEDPEEEANPPKESTRFLKRLGVHTYKAQAKQLKTNMFAERRRHKSLYKRFVKDILEYYDDYKQDPKTMEKKDEAIKALQKELQSVFPLNSVRVFAIGPSADGCGAKTSGLDATLLIDEKFPAEWTDLPIRKKINQYREYQLDCLERVNRHLSGSNRHDASLEVIDFVKNDPEANRESEVVLGPELPFVRIAYYSSKVSLLGKKKRPTDLKPSVFMNVFVNDVASIYNAHLIYNYTKIDKRFPEITLAIKGWAANNLASKQGPQFLTSPTLCMMVIHYLQSGIEPPVLPNLHYIHPKQFGEQAILWESDLRAPGRVLVPEWRNNGTPIHEQLVGFFHYFANLDYRHKAISIRSARIVNRQSVYDEYGSYIVIEDPFKLKNTTRVINGHIYRKIVTSFCAAALAMTSRPIMHRLLDEDPNTRPNIRGREMKEVRQKHIRNCQCRLPDEDDNTLELGPDGVSIPCPPTPPRNKGAKKQRARERAAVMMGIGPDENTLRYGPPPPNVPYPLMPGLGGGGRRPLARHPPSLFPTREGLLGTGPSYDMGYDQYYGESGVQGDYYYPPSSGYYQESYPPPPPNPVPQMTATTRALPPQLDPAYADFYAAYSYQK